MPRLGLESDGSAPQRWRTTRSSCHTGRFVRGVRSWAATSTTAGTALSRAARPHPVRRRHVILSRARVRHVLVPEPAPDADFTASVEGSTATAKLHQFQGGWSQAVPRHARHEVMHHDEHFASNIDPTTYGMMPGRNRREENAQHQLRYNYDGTTPFGVDGRTDTLERPAHMMGSENYAYRFAPYMPPTARDTELTYVATANQQHGSAAQRTRQVFTIFTQRRAGRRTPWPRPPAARTRRGRARPGLGGPTATRACRPRTGSAADPTPGPGARATRTPPSSPPCAAPASQPDAGPPDGSTRHGAPRRTARGHGTPRAASAASSPGRLRGRRRRPVAAAAALHDQIVTPTRRPALTGVPTGSRATVRPTRAIGL